MQYVPTDSDDGSILFFWLSKKPFIRKHSYLDKYNVVPFTVSIHMAASDTWAHAPGWG